MADEKKIHNYEKDDLLARPTTILKVKAHIDLAQDTNHHNLKDLHIALGDRYRKFYRTLNNAKKPFIQYSIQKNFNTIHSKFYSFKI